jgi:hypothetical protein
LAELLIELRERKTIAPANHYSGLRKAIGMLRKLSQTNILRLPSAWCNCTFVYIACSGYLTRECSFYELQRIRSTRGSRAANVGSDAKAVASFSSQADRMQARPVANPSLHGRWQQLFSEHFETVADPGPPINALRRG